jgi:predicted nucleic acid-binding protein
MTVFIDTSALLAVMDAGDENHSKADRFWKKLLGGEESLLTSNYVLIETIALLQNRIGLDAVRALDREVLPAITVRWIGEREHGAALSAVLSAGRRRLSLVDCTSFELMKDMGLRRCFAFDPHFREQGFDRLP